MEVPAPSEESMLLFQKSVGHALNSAKSRDGEQRDRDLVLIKNLFLAIMSHASRVRLQLMELIADFWKLLNARPCCAEKDTMIQNKLEEERGIVSRVEKLAIHSILLNKDPDTQAMLTGEVKNALKAYQELDSDIGKMHISFKTSYDIYAAFTREEKVSMEKEAFKFNRLSDMMESVGDGASKAMVDAYHEFCQQHSIKDEAKAMFDAKFTQVKDLAGGGWSG